MKKLVKVSQQTKQYRKEEFRNRACTDIYPYLNRLNITTLSNH